MQGKQPKSYINLFSRLNTNCPTTDQDGAAAGAGEAMDQLLLISTRAREQDTAPQMDGQSQQKQQGHIQAAPRPSLKTP